jgi:TolB-like protein
MTDLSRIPDMLVISRNTAFTYRNKAVDTTAGCASLVRYVPEGEVQRSGNRVRATAQLIDAESDVHFWRERFDGDASDLFGFQGGDHKPDCGCSRPRAGGRGSCTVD